MVMNDDLTLPPGDSFLDIDQESVNYLTETCSVEKKSIRQEMIYYLEKRRKVHENVFDLIITENDRR